MTDALLAERLAIVDEIHNDVAHALAVASIHLGLLDPEGRGRAAGAPGVAQVACQRALEGVRRARRMALAQGEDPESVGPDLAHLEQLAGECDATVVVAPALPAGEALAAGVLLTVSRIAEAFLRITAHHGATVRVGCTARTLRVEADCELPPEEWVRRQPDVDRVRERMRWFDGRLTLTPSGGGTHAVAELPW